MLGTCPCRNSRHQPSFAPRLPSRTGSRRFRVGVCSSGWGVDGATHALVAGLARSAHLRWLHQDVILTIQYRNGALSFMSQRARPCTRCRRARRAIHGADSRAFTRRAPLVLQRSLKALCTYDPLCVVTERPQTWTSRGAHSAEVTDTRGCTEPAHTVASKASKPLYA
jgi:hypothetical protein